MSKFVIVDNVIKLSHNRKVHTIQRSHQNYEEIVEALKGGKFDEAYVLFKAQKGNTPNVLNKVVEKMSDKAGINHFQEAYVASRLHGFKKEALELFFDNVAKNPNPVSVSAFANFLSACRMPITDRGTFLAYRRCNSSYKDKHTGKFDNRPGTVCRMPRKSCDANQNETCSTGFHVCNFNYLGHFGNSSEPVLVVEIRPQDVVAVPPDYNLSKMRTASFRSLMRLDAFKQHLMLPHFDADVLGGLPFLKTEAMKGWNFTSGVSNMEGAQIVPVEEWLAYDGE